jgi:lysozyme
MVELNDKTRSRVKNSIVVVALAVALVGAWEGLRTKAYRDAVGVPTVCYGETRGVRMGDRYTVEQCKVMLGDGLVDFELGIRK